MPPRLVETPAALPRRPPPTPRPVWDGLGPADLRSMARELAAEGERGVAAWALAEAAREERARVDTYRAYRPWGGASDGGRGPTVQPLPRKRKPTA